MLHRLQFTVTKPTRVFEYDCAYSIGFFTTHANYANPFGKKAATFGMPTIHGVLLNCSTQ